MTDPMTSNYPDGAGPDPDPPGAPMEPAGPPPDYNRDGAIQSVYAAMRQRYLDTGREIDQPTALCLLENAQYAVDTALLMTGRRYVVLQAGVEQHGYDVAAAVIAGDPKANGRVPDAVDVKEGLAVINRLIKDA